MSRKIEVTGPCHYVGEVVRLGNNGFTKRTVVIDVSEFGKEWKNYVAFTLKKDKCDLVSPDMKGKTLTIAGFVDAREWIDPNTKEPKYFTDVTATSVSVVQGEDDSEEVDRGEEIAVDDMPF